MASTNKKCPTIILIILTMYLSIILVCGNFSDPKIRINKSSLPSHRIPRSTTSKKLKIDVLVVADKSMSDFHGTDLPNYVSTLLNITAGILRDPSIGQSLRVELYKLIPLDYEFNVTTIENNKTTAGVDAAELLWEFLQWQMTQNFSGSHDTALLLTRLDLCEKDGSCMKAGMAEVGTICVKERSGLVIEDNGLSAGFAIAHELGHLLSLGHDDEDSCLWSPEGYEAEEKSNEFRVMSSSNEVNWNPWEWSQCSRNDLSKFLSDGKGNCLEENSDEEKLDSNSADQLPEGFKLPGELYSMTNQCRLFTGESKPNLMDRSLIGLVCPEIDCQSLICPEQTNTSLRCVVWNKLPADGTPCGHWNSSNIKWCRRGHCVDKLSGLDNTENIQVNGGWGNWTEYEACSRSCGGGVQCSRRECDSPPPQNGGEFCLGDRIRYASCNTMDCPSKVDDFESRGKQCEKFDGNNLSLPNIPENVSWIPVPHRILKNFDMNDRCKLLCMNRQDPRFLYRLNNQNVIDGTRCDEMDPLNFDICVNGACLPAGCDHVLYSDKSMDACGVCGGKNETCRPISKWLDDSMIGMVDPKTLFQIPKGAFHLEITHYSALNQSRYSHNFLALFDPVSQKYVFNDPVNRRIYTHGGKAEGAGILINYSGYNFLNRNDSEIIESLIGVVEGKATESELILQIFTNNPNVKVPYRIFVSYILDSILLVEEEEEQWTFWDWRNFVPNFLKYFSW